MTKYPQVKAFFAKNLGDEHGKVRAGVRKKLADRAGTTQATVSRWVTGVNRPDAMYWNAIAEVGDISITKVRKGLGAFSEDADNLDTLTLILDQMRELSSRFDALETRIDLIAPTEPEALPPEPRRR